MNALYDERKNRMAKLIETKADKDIIKKLEDKSASDAKRFNNTIE
jgi:hypothetical protein